MPKSVVGGYLGQRRALITGITGQDGAYLAQLLLEKNYEVIGTCRGENPNNNWRLQELGILGQVSIRRMDLLDSVGIDRIVTEVQPTEIYNLAALSNIASSLADPVYTAEVDALGPARILEAIRKFAPRARFCQASSSEIFGGAEGSLTEETPLKPRNPYAAAKAYAHSLAFSYRVNFGVYATSAILFNHESPLRGENFVTRKISKGMAQLRAGNSEPIQLGNVDSRRDWGHARDYVRGLWLMLQPAQADDYVFSTGVTYSIQDYLEASARCAGFELRWGECVEKKRWAYDQSTGLKIVEVDVGEIRSNDTSPMRGNSQKAQQILGWQPSISFQELVIEMTRADLARQLGASTQIHD